MIISTSNDENTGTLDKVFYNSKISIERASSENIEFYLQKSPTDFEEIVFNSLVENSKNTVYEDTFSLISGSKFPDIISKRYRLGIEVKTSKKDHWSTTGNSVQENSRMENIEKIFFFFIKQIVPISIRYKLYQECISDVAITHSPRYLVNMELSHGNTFFDRLGIDYDTLRQTQDPAKIITKYFRDHANPGELTWWMGEEPPSELIANEPIRPTIMLFSNLSTEEKNKIICFSFARFPEIMGKSNNKFNRLVLWLVGYKGIVSTNLRDYFTAGGKSNITINGETFSNVPRIFINLMENFPKVIQMITNLSNEEICDGWGIKSTSLPNERIQFWKNKVITYSEDQFSDVRRFLDLLVITT